MQRKSSVPHDLTAPDRHGDVASSRRPGDPAPLPRASHAHRLGQYAIQPPAQAQAIQPLTGDRISGPRPGSNALLPLQREVGKKEGEEGSSASPKFHIEGYGEIDTAAPNWAQEEAGMIDESMDPEINARIHHQLQEHPQLLEQLAKHSSQIRQHVKLATRTTSVEATNSAGPSEASSAPRPKPNPEQAIEIGNAAIAHAREVIPRAGNQAFDLDEDPRAAQRAAQTLAVSTAFHRHLRQRMSFPMDASLHPQIRSQIAQCTGGGLCGEYAALAHTYIQRHHPHAAPKIVKSADHGDHAWVQIETSGGGKMSVDPWPTQTRQVVPPDQHFTTPNDEKTRGVEESMQLQEPHMAQIHESWQQFQQSQEFRQAVETAKPSAAAPLDIRSTRRPQEIDAGPSESSEEAQTNSAHEDD